jgi:Icc-related predicted phosphoesterase
MKKLLVTADLHYNLKQFDWLLRQVGEVDAMVLAGDFLDIGSYVSADVQSQVVEKYLEKLRQDIRVFASSGNHDVDQPAEGAAFAAEWLQDLRDTGIEVDGDTVDVGDVTISICPWTLYPDQQEQALASLRAAGAKRKGTWIWVHHSPPDQTPISWTGKLHFGDLALKEWIEELKPDLVFCGHVHQAPFHSSGSWKVLLGRTVAFNAGYEMSSTPPHLWVDLNTRTVEWCCSEESMSLQY